MMPSSSKSNYESIPSSETNTGASSEGLSSKRKLVIPFVFVLLAGTFFGATSNRDMSVNSLKDSPKEIQKAEQSIVNWPQYIHKAGRPPIFHVDLPITTAEAVDSGWVKIEDEPCNEKLGEPWRIGGKRSKETSVTLYFTPQVSDTPGSVAAIENDYYDRVEENLVGTYFKSAAEAEEGTYWSIAVLLRQPTVQGLCDTSHPVPIQEERYFAVAPEMINNVYPSNNNDAEMNERFMEGMCAPGMGFHYFADVVGGPKLTYKASNLNPVTPMYSSQTGKIQGFYFIGTDVLKRNWPNEACKGFGPSSFGCAMTQPGVAPGYSQSMWDWVVPALWEESMAPFFMCNQFCDPNCGFTGGKDFPELGIPAGFVTMHFFFDVEGETCEGFQDHHFKEKGAHFYCRDKSMYPEHKLCDGTELCK